MKLRLLKLFGLIAFTAILAGLAAFVFAITARSVADIAAREIFITTFGGAFFAYLFVKIGELFTRLYKHEKLHLDTTVRLQYVLNDHLNKLSTNIYVADNMLTTLAAQPTGGIALNFMRFKPLFCDTDWLRDMRNRDLINDAFQYFTDIEKINDDLSMLQRFIDLQISNALAGTQPTSVIQAHQANAAFLTEMIQQIKAFMEAADKKCVTLIGKSEFVSRHRNPWLSLPVSLNPTGYNQERLKRELPKILAEFERGREANTAASTAEIAAVQRSHKPNK